MLTFKVFLFLITLSVAKSEMDHKTMCKNDFRDEKNNSIDVFQYCYGKICIEKCCGPDGIFFTPYASCIKMRQFRDMLKKHAYLESQYNSINILSFFNVTETMQKKVVFIQNQRNSVYLKNCTLTHSDKDRYVLAKDGSLQAPETSGSENTIKKLHYCIDKNIVIVQMKPLLLKITTIVRGLSQDPSTTELIRKIEITGIFISSSFLLLVLIVYCLLPNLRNLTGLVLMGYTWTLLVAFIMKLIINYSEMNDNFCKIISPFLYFAFVSSIFWLSVYAFDVWWGLRSFRIQRNSRHGQLVKFLWYALYAWGTPLLFTTIMAVLDNLSDLKLAVKIPFENCFQSGVALDYYYKIPISILLFINIVLFCMTVYNIWMVKRAINKCHDSRKRKQQSNKFATYAKLFLMMGVSWCMELLPKEEEVWEYVLINSYNLFTGVNIFYMFVCKKTILLQLCQKFNIRNDYIKNLELELTQNRTQSRITRSTGLSSTVKRRSNDQPQEDLLQNCPEEETTGV